MKITEKQLQLLVQILQDSLRLIDGNGVFCINHETRQTLYKQIMSQQSEELREVE